MAEDRKAEEKKLDPKTKFVEAMLESSKKKGAVEVKNTMANVDVKEVEKITKQIQAGKVHEIMQKKKRGEKVEFY